MVLGSDDRAGYPFAELFAGDDASPLWALPPHVLDRVSADDATRLTVAIASLVRATELAVAERGLLRSENVEELRASERARVRAVWWSFLDAILAVDRFKQRYEGWYGIDWFEHRRLHARAFSLAFAALCAQVYAGHQLMGLVGGRDLAQTLFDEAQPEVGLPSGTFAALRSRLARSRDHSYVLVGAEWYEQWIAEHLGDDEPGATLAVLVKRNSARARELLGADSAANTVLNKLELLKSVAFATWFPVQRDVAEWLGDTRLVSEGVRLVRDEQIAELARHVAPGDILLERRNWYLSNVGLPGFWPHAALYSGDRAEIARAFDADPAVRERFGTFSEHLARAHPAAWAALGERDPAGHQRRVLEAVSEGVVAATFEHTCAADYVAVVRPRLPSVEIARAIDRACSFFGRPYDFAFDFATDDALVCSELVAKAFEPESDDGPGLRLPYESVAGKRVVSPTRIAALYATERNVPSRQLDFVYFLDGIEQTGRAVVSNADAFAGSVTRPKWDLLQK